MSAREVSVVSRKDASGWTCMVQVSESNGQTRHNVTVSQRDFEQLTAGKSITPEQLVKRSFEFLLEREPKESILRQFNLLVISRYFPEFLSEIRKKL